MEPEVSEEDISECFAILARCERRDAAKCQRRKELVLRLASDELKEVLEEEFDDDGIHTITLTKKRPHKSYLESGYGGLPRYVEQHCGCCGDDFYGSIWYQLTARHWVKMDFAY